MFVLFLVIYEKNSNLIYKNRKRIFYLKRLFIDWKRGIFHFLIKSYSFLSNLLHEKTFNFYYFKTNFKKQSINLLQFKMKICQMKHFIDLSYFSQKVKDLFILPFITLKLKLLLLIVDSINKAKYHSKC